MRGGIIGLFKRSAPLGRDVLSSLVVFLVALPLCIGIAVACGVSAERGIVSGIVGGVVVGWLAGSPLLVTGPAASLIVPVNDLLQTHGIGALGPVVMLAGVWQLLAGVLKLGQWFRAVAPSVILGMLIGIGMLITGSQLHVAVGSDPASLFVDNVRTLGAVILTRFSGGLRIAEVAPVVIGATTITLIVAWHRFRPKRLKLVPGHLISLTVVTTVVALLDLPVRFLDISPSFFSGIEPVSPVDLKLLLVPAVLKVSFIFAFVASAATLLTATAIDQRQSHASTNYNREMLAQGAGNLMTGALGGLPMTGVIVRSSVNVDAGARTRLSTILHGLWILGFVVIAPEVLERIPRASLGAILVYTGIKLINIKGLRELYARGRADLAIALLTVFGVVFVDLFDGIIMGLVAAIAKLIYSFTHLEVRSDHDTEGHCNLHLAGSASFLRLPLLAEALEKLPLDRELHVHVERLSYIDHACLELLSHARKRREQAGGPRMVLEWGALAERYDRTNIAGAGAHGERNKPSKLLAVLWHEWRRLYAPEHGSRPAGAAPMSAEWLSADRIRLRLDLRRVTDVIEVAAELIAPAVQLPSQAVAAALQQCSVDGCVVLGDRIGLPHAPLEGVTSPRAALITTKQPVQVGDDAIDMFFVVVAPAAEPRLHLVALAHVGRLCHDLEGLAAIRRSTSSEDALRLIHSAEQFPDSVERRPHASKDEELLVVIDLEGSANAEHALQEFIEEAYPASSVRVVTHNDALTPLTRLLGISTDHRYVVLTVEQGDLATLRRLLSESARLLADCDLRMHVLRRSHMHALETPP